MNVYIINIIDKHIRRIVMKKNEKKFTFEYRKKLKILIEDFLDKDWKEILDDEKNKGLNLKQMIIFVGEGILLPYRYYGDELEEHNDPIMEKGEFSESITDDDRKKLLYTLHRNLKPLWDKIKKKICHYKWPQKLSTLKKRKNKLPHQEGCKEEILDYNPNTNQFEYKKVSVDNAKINFSEYEDLAAEGSYVDTLEIYEDIKIHKPRSIARDRENKFSTIEIKINFNGGEINLIREDVDLVNNFIEFMKGLPLDVFSKCEKCGRLIIVTRRDRKCCSINCAAGLIQKRKWEEDREDCRLKEKGRNQKRKASKTH